MPSAHSLLLAAAIGGAAVLARPFPRSSRAAAEERSVNMIVPRSLGTNNTIVQLFAWPWTSVASECTDFLAPYGYGAAQVSPPQETITGTQWWTDYQPVSYTIDGKRGTRDEFSSMVSTCHDVGVKIIVDAVLNHMTAGSGTGIDGDSYTKYSYPAVPYTSDDFHDASNPCTVSDYDNQTNVQECELEGLADLYTESTTVRTTLANYLKDLQSLGVDGFRLDAAKHINPADIAAILSDAGGSPYITQEVIYGAGEAVQPSQYTGNGNVMIFKGTSDLQGSFTNWGIQSLVTPTAWGPGWGSGYLPSDEANVFVADHDTERSTDSLNAASANNAFALAHVFLLSFNYSTPTVYSGYDFSGYDDGPPNTNSYTNDVTCWQTWRCEHRWQSIANMVAFHNAVEGESVDNIVSSGSNAIAYGRGSTGFVAINNQASAWSSTFQTSLPAGSYCDVVHGAFNTSSPCPTKYTVASDGTFSASVGAYDALAIYVGSPTGEIGSGGSSSSGGTVSTTFSVDATTTWGEASPLLL